MVKAGVIVIAAVIVTITILSNLLNANWWFRDVFSLIRMQFDSSIAVPLRIPIDLSKKGIIVESEFKIKDKRGYYFSFYFLDADSRKNNFNNIKKMRVFLGLNAYNPYSGKQSSFNDYEYAKRNYGDLIDKNYNLDGTIIPLHVTLYKLNKNGTKELIKDKIYQTKGSSGFLGRDFEQISLQKGKYFIRVESLKAFRELKGIETTFRINMTRRYK